MIAFVEEWLQTKYYKRVTHSGVENVECIIT